MVIELFEVMAALCLWVLAVVVVLAVRAPPKVVAGVKAHRDRRLGKAAESALRPLYESTSLIDEATRDYLADRIPRDVAISRWEQAVEKAARRDERIDPDTGMPRIDPWAEPLAKGEAAFAGNGVVTSVERDREWARRRWELLNGAGPELPAAGPPDSQGGARATAVHITPYGQVVAGSPYTGPTHISGPTMRF